MDFTKIIEANISDSSNLKVNPKLYFKFWNFILKKQWKVFVFYSVFLIFMSSLTPIFMFIWKQYIDSATTVQMISQSIIIVCIYITIRVIVDFCDFFAMRFMEAINFSSWRVLDSTINEKATKISPEYYEVPNIQNKINRAWSFSHGSYIEIYQLGLNTLRQFILLVGIFVSLFIVSPLVCLIALITIIPAIISKFINDKLSFFNSRSLSDDENKLNYYKRSISSQNLIKEIILNSSFAFFQKKYETKLQQIFKKNTGIEIKKTKLIVLDELIGKIIILFCIILISYQYIQGEISIGGIAVAFSLVLTLVYSLADFVSSGCSLFTVTFNISQFYELMDLSSEVNTEIEDTKLFNSDYDKIKFNNINYRYPLTETFVIKNLNIEIMRGQNIAVVGANGSGKSTFVKLFAKLLQPTLGTIYVDSDNLINISNEKYWRSFACVFQDYNKFKESLRYNVGIGSSDDMLNEKKINAALNAAEFDKDIEIDCILSKEFGGIELSGGEWQKIAIARSLIKDNNTFILDEPTSSIDPITEASLYKKFTEICKGKTSVFVTHRLGSVLYSDIVVFLRDGEIVECGTHEKLLAVNGEYAKFWNTQASLYEYNL